MKKFRNSLIASNIWPVVVCLIFTQATTAQIIYVNSDANGLNNGSSWADAYNYLQDALYDPCLAYGDDIWVAEDTYTPDNNFADPNGSSDRTATFQLINGVALYGGFPGTGDPNFDDREPNLYETVLSGDLAGNDVEVNDPCDLLTEPTRAENSYHVVSASGTDSNTILNGFTITAGNANGAHPYDWGGGVNNDHSSSTIANCLLKNNSAHSGGGICNNYSSPRLTNCIFERNSTGVATGINLGGGLYNRYYSNTTLINCAFFQNYAYSGGGGLRSYYYCNIVLQESAFIANSAYYAGGGMSCSVDSPTELTNCTFTDNLSLINHGGAIEAQTRSSIILRDCTLTSNKGIYGGAVTVSGDTRIDAISCVFRKNTGRKGGALHLSPYSRANINSTTFIRNIANYPTYWDSEGGAIYSWGDMTLTNCTLRSNSSIRSGGAVCLISSDPNRVSTARLMNCIFYNNTAPRGSQISLAQYGSLSDYFIALSNCCIQGGEEAIYMAGANHLDWGEGNIDEDPMLTPDGHLREGSPR